jgi:hypothetical protein
VIGDVEFTVRLFVIVYALGIGFGVYRVLVIGFLVWLWVGVIRRIEGWAVGI